jgi:hypothetical protein
LLLKFDFLYHKLLNPHDFRNFCILFCNLIDKTSNKLLTRTKSSNVTITCSNAISRAINIHLHRGLYKYKRDFQRSKPLANVLLTNYLLFVIIYYLSKYFDMGIYKSDKSVILQEYTPYKYPYAVWQS